MIPMDITSQTGFKGTYAHHLQLAGDFRSLNQLSFGLSAGVILSSLDETEFRSVIPDPIVTGVKNTTSYFNVDLGASYNYLEFYAHAAILKYSWKRKGFIHGCRI